MNVRVTKRAQAQIDRAAGWWEENRDLAHKAFDEDLAKAFLLLSAEPGIGAPVLRAAAPLSRIAAGATRALGVAASAARAAGFPYAVTLSLTPKLCSTLITVS